MRNWTRTLISVRRRSPSKELERTSFQAITPMTALCLRPGVSFGHFLVGHKTISYTGIKNLILHATCLFVCSRESNMSFDRFNQTSQSTTPKPRLPLSEVALLLASTLSGIVLCGLFIAACLKRKYHHRIHRQPELTMQQRVYYVRDPDLPPPYESCSQSPLPPPYSAK